MSNPSSSARLSQANQVMDAVDRARQGAIAVPDGEALRALVRTTYQEQGIEVDDVLIQSAVEQLLGQSATPPALATPPQRPLLPARSASLKTWWLQRRSARRADRLAKHVAPVVQTPQSEAQKALEDLQRHRLHTDDDIGVRLDELWQEAEMARRWAGWKSLFWIALSISGPVYVVLSAFFFKAGMTSFMGLSAFLTLFLMPVFGLNALAGRARHRDQQKHIGEARTALERLDYKSYILNRLLETKTGRMEPLSADSILWDIAKRGAAAHSRVGEIWGRWLDSDKVIRDCDVWLLSETCDKLAAGREWALRKKCSAQGAASQALIRTKLKDVLPAPKPVSSPKPALKNEASTAMMMKLASEEKMNAMLTKKFKPLGGGKQFSEMVCDMEMKMLDNQLNTLYKKLSKLEKSLL